MSRSNRNRKRRRRDESKRTLSNNRFRQEYCRSCGICGIGHKPKFCYNTLFREQPDEFDEVHESLINVKEFIISFVTNPDSVGRNIAHSIFKANFCENLNCPSCTRDTRSLSRCFGAFVEQARGHKIANTTFKKTKIVIPATPFIIMSNKDGFEEDVRRLLENYNSKQDKTRKSS